MISVLIIAIFVVDAPSEVNSKAYVLREEHFKKSPFNGTCDKSILCDPEFICVSKRCQCKPGTVYETTSKVCWDIPQASRSTSGRQISCYYDIQCQAGNWGKSSRCNQSTRKCECYDQYSKGKREMVTIVGVCHVMRFVGDHCDINTECQRTIEGPVQCNGHRWRCECKNGFISDRSRKSCKPIVKKSKDTCEMDEQCQLGPFGQFSKCLTTGQCQCADGLQFREDLGVCKEDKPEIEDDPDAEELHEKAGGFAGKFGDRCVISYQCKTGALGNYSKCLDWQCQCHSPEGEETSYHPITHKCFLRIGYNESCHSDEECEASLGFQVKCGHPNGVSMETGRVCYCPFGKVCRSNNDTSSSNSIQINSLVTILLLSLCVMIIQLNT